jgi:hypothetical protein
MAEKPILVLGLELARMGATEIQDESPPAISTAGLRLPFKCTNAWLGSSASSWSEARPALFGVDPPAGDGNEAGREEASAEEVHGEAAVHSEAEVHLGQGEQTLAHCC